MKTSAKHFDLAVGPRPGNMSQNGPKTASLMMSLTKNCNPQPKILFRVQTRRLADQFKSLNSSSAQLTEELWRWQGN